MHWEGTPFGLVWSGGWGTAKNVREQKGEEDGQLNEGGGCGLYPCVGLRKHKWQIVVTKMYENSQPYVVGL